MSQPESSDVGSKLKSFFSLSGSASPSTDNGVVTNIQGIIQMPDGTVYQGSVLDAKPNGFGSITDLRGRNQQGEWRMGKEYHVSGTLIYPDGTKEVGTWNNDGTRSGGTITWKDGRQYKGEWKLTDNSPEIPDGRGEMSWPDGRKYVGQFYNGKMDGAGKMTYPNGKIEDGLWKQDKFLGASH